MNKSKILYSVLVGLLLGFSVVIPTKTLAKEPSSQVSYLETEKILEFESVKILDSNYDLSSVRSAGLLRAIISTFDNINSTTPSLEENSEKFLQVKNMLEEYFKNPEQFDNVPETLDLNPSVFLRDEVVYVQGKIEELNKEKESIANSEESEQFKNDRISEIQNDIDMLRNWINFSITGFKSSEYKQTFLNSDNLVSSNSDDLNLISSVVSPDFDYKNLFGVSLDSNGNFLFENYESSSEHDIVSIIRKEMEFKNFKVRHMLNEALAEVNDMGVLQIVNFEKDKELEKLNREIEQIKADFVAQEILLLNIEKEAIGNTKISEEAKKEKIDNINKLIKEKLDILTDFTLNFGGNQDYKIEGSDLGKYPTLFGYVFEDESGLSVKIYLDENYKISFSDDMNIPEDKKAKLKEVISKEISDVKSKISELNNSRLQVESLENKDKERVIYLVDNEIFTLNNIVYNYEKILEQI